MNCVCLYKYVYKIMFYLIQIFSISIDYSFQQIVFDMSDAPGWVCVLLGLDLPYTCTLTLIISLSPLQ